MEHVIRLIRADEVVAWYATLAAQHAHNGRGGIYATTRAAPPSPTPERVASVAGELARGLAEPQWLRVFGVWCGDRMVGHADLSGGSWASDLHRCTLGVGLEPEHQGRGVGTRLMNEVIAWARTEGLSWMDLCVFEGNGPALALYTRLGFREVGRVADRHRVGDVRLAEIAMALSLA